MGTHPVAISPAVRRAAVAVVALLSAIGLVTMAGTAGAQPQPTISQVQAKLNKLTSQMNVLVQRFDQVNQDLSAARERLALVKREVGKDQAQFEAMRGQIAQIAAAAYENGSMTSTAAVLTSNNPQRLLAQSAILTHLSTDSHTQLAQFITMARALTGAEQNVKRTETAVAKLKQQLAGQKATLDKLITKQRGILDTLTAQQQQQQLGGSGGTGGGGTYNGPTKTQAQKAVAFAYSALGCHYVYGAAGPCGAGFDCSGLTSAAWAYAGVTIPRTSYGQAGLPAVSTSNLQPGDILEYAGDSHVGIYVGGGMLIDAPQPGINVEKISMSSSWYAQNYDGAVRP